MTVVGFGLSLVDLLVISDTHVELNTKNRIARRILQFGGPVPTALVVLSRLGISCTISTVRGDDAFGKMLEDIFTKEHVWQQNIKILSGAETPTAVVIIDKTVGERTIFYSTGMFATVDPAVFPQNLDEQTKMLIIDGHNYACANAFIDQARKVHATVLLDVGTPKKDIDKLIDLADVVFVPRSYWTAVYKTIAPENIPAEIIKRGPKTVVITMEADGCIVADRNGVFHQPAYKIKAVDTNGAGDVFLGAFAYGLLQQWDLKQTAQFTSATAALKCTKIGKDESLPHSKVSIDQFIAEYDKGV